MADDAGEVDGDNWIERNSKTITTLATVAIPVVLAVIGYVANANINKQTLDRQYVELSYKILSSTMPSDDEQDRCDASMNEAIGTDGREAGSPGIDSLRSELPLDILEGLPAVSLRAYGLDLLVATTPVELSIEQYVSLLCGKVSLPVTEPETGDGGEAASAADTGETGSADGDTEIISAYSEAFKAIDAESEKLSDCEVIVSGDALTLDRTRLEEGSYTATDRLAGADIIFVRIQVAPGDLEWIPLTDDVALNVECATKS
jgi:hypothetical protein